MAIVDADAAASAGWTLEDLAAAFLDGGAKLLQIRAKHLSSGAFLESATAIIRRAHGAGAAVVVNDRADIARLADADGVHVGQTDLPPNAVRTMIGPGGCIGLSTHSAAQIEDAFREPISYVAIGPVYGTATKATGYEPVGLERVRDAARERSARTLPVVAIGGITLENAAAVIAAGAASVAIISDLLVGGDPASRVRAYLEHLTV